MLSDDFHQPCDAMDHGEDHADDAIQQDDDDQSTQPQTQSTQPASQSQSSQQDVHLWGYLQPCNPELVRIEFFKVNPKVTIGRNPENNIVVLPGFKVSNYHCEITWDGNERADAEPSVTVVDLSSNGTYINGKKIGKNCSKLLREGNEISFGSNIPQSVGITDYRFVYRHVACGPPKDGLYKFYDIDTELGTGSFAKVVRAMHLETGKWYAVKMIQDKRNNGSVTTGTNQTPEGEQPPPPPRRRKGEPSRREVLAREISIMEKLKHQNICEMKEVFFENNGDINLVLELVEGGDLLDYILRSDVGLAEDAAKHLTYQMCDALAYIHDQGVAHRDLKPENILLTKDTPPRIKVADFGLAKIVDSVTMLRTMCGTPSYLAPEVVQQDGLDGYDHLVDSWSVGVIVFSMLTNASPFIEDENQRDIRMRIIERRVDWSVLDAVNVSDEGKDFIHGLLNVNPRERTSLRDALDHPWLRDYEPVYGCSPQLQESRSGGHSRHLPNDISMLSVVPEENSMDAAAMAAGTNAGSAAAHNTNGVTPPPEAYVPNGIRREGSRTAPLQRRAHVFAEAAEGNRAALPEPSWEMINAASQEQANGSGDETNGAGPSTAVGQKRVRQEMSPLREDDVAMEDDMDVDERRQQMDVVDSPRKSRAARGGGRARGGVVKTTARGRGRGAAAAAAPEEGALRRSTRNTPAGKLPRVN
ncbi:hypothetical protein HGRIS_003031 [Hohenbuehelia grisea]|uniref:Pkinase-domain-containing protein n=1 Tax=Hohenbuehelia grisea TaxID=104357 RepID=A0ABR3JNM2_9AGAR